MRALSDIRFWATVAVCVTVICVVAVVTNPSREESSSGVAGQPASESAPAAAAKPMSRTQIAEMVQAAELDEAKQKQIWDAEHITFLVEAHLCKPFHTQLKDKRWEDFGKWFRDDFQGEVFEVEPGDERRQGIVSEKSIKPGSRLRPVDAAGLEAYLLEGIKDFAKVDRARLRILHIHAEGEGDTIWNTEMLLAVVGETAGGSPIQRVSKHDVQFVVKDKEGFKEEIQNAPTIRRWVTTSAKVRHSESRFLEEITSAVGLDRLPINDNWKLPKEEAQQYRFKMAVADFDRDGFLDIAAAPDSLEPVLLRSVEGKKFEFVADRMGLEPFDYDETGFMNLLAAWIDYDNDGYPDLIMGNRLYHNEAGKRFTDVTAKSGLRIMRDPNGCVVADYDCDGHLDLYVLNQVPKQENLGANMPWVGDTEHGAENQLWRNRGDGVFEDVTAKAGVGGGKRESFAAAWLFHDEDRFPDLYVANDFGENVLFRNRGDGTFEDVTKDSGAGDYATSMGVTSGDLNNDGRPEIYVANMYSKMGRRIIAYVNESDYPEGIYEQIKGSCAGNRLYMAGGEGERYVEQGEGMGVDAVGWAYAPAMVDLDNDGWLDLYATTGFMSFERHKPDG